MGMVAIPDRIASTYVVVCGVYGDVTRQARQRQISRQAIYRQSERTVADLEGAWLRAEAGRLQEQVRAQQAQVVALEKRLSEAVVLTPDVLRHFAATGEARGVSLADIRALLQVLQGEEAPSVATLGRWTKEAGAKAAALLPVLDALARTQVRQASADEIYVKAPVLMVVEPESLCWVTGQLSATADGEAWTQQLRVLGSLEQVARDGGHGLRKGVRRVDAARRAEGRPGVADQLDHFHTVREGNRALRYTASRARRGLEQAESAQAELDKRLRQGQNATVASVKASRLWKQAEKAWDEWRAVEQAWRRTQEALPLFTPGGELNSREQAEAVLSQTLPLLPDADFAKTKRLLRQPQTLTYLDEVHRKLAALPASSSDLREAAVRLEGGRRRPERLQGESRSAATLRALQLACTVLLAKAGESGEEMVRTVRSIFRNTWRASSLVEGINSVLRMHQARHRRLTQGLLDLKRLYWNCRTFRTGRRRGQSPYQRLGLLLPQGLDWWDLLKMTPEQLRDQLSALNKAE
jgi:hypothetical protein